MQFSTLFLISLFSVSIALSGCVGSDNSSAPTKPNQPTNPETNNPNDNTDDDNSSGGDGDNGGNDSGGSSGGDNNGGNDDSGGNGSGDGSTGGNTTPDPVSCNAPETSITDTSFGDVGDVTKYDIDDYAEINADSADLEGTWVIIGKDTATANRLDESSIYFLQKYFLVIKKDKDDSYQVANCAGKVITENIQGALDCRDKNNEVIDCPDGADIGKIGTDYKEFTGFLETPKESNSKIMLPIFGLSGINFDLQSNEYMTAEGDMYFAKKISTDILSLGAVNITSTRLHTKRKNLFISQLTDNELKDLRDTDVDSSYILDGYKIDSEHDVSYVLSEEVGSSPAPYTSNNITCISQQLLFTRECKADKTNSLSIITASSDSSHHSLFASKNEEKEQFNNITANNLRVHEGKTTEDPMAGTEVNQFSELLFLKTSTTDAKDMKLTLKANKTVDGASSHEKGMVTLCSPSKVDYESLTGGDCVNEEKKTYKFIIEIISTDDEKELNVEIKPNKDYIF